MASLAALLLLGAALYYLLRGVSRWTVARFRALAVWLREQNSLDQVRTEIHFLEKQIQEKKALLSRKTFPLWDKQDYEQRARGLYEALALNFTQTGTHLKPETRLLGFYRVLEFHRAKMSVRQPSTEAVSEYNARVKERLFHGND